MPISSQQIARFVLALWRQHGPKIDRTRWPWRIRFGPPIRVVSIEVLVDRLSKCRDCEFRDVSKCSLCGCHLPTKAQWATEQCPIEEWTAENSSGENS